jgi:hypothetical protein
MKGWELLNLKRRGEKKSESSIEFVAYTHTQTLYKKGPNWRNDHILLSIYTECYWTQLPHQKTLKGKLD